MTGSLKAALVCFGLAAGASACGYAISQPASYHAGAAHASTIPGTYQDGLLTSDDGTSAVPEPGTLGLVGAALVIAWLFSQAAGPRRQTIGAGDSV